MKNQKAFTLIELIVTITIMVLVWWATFMNFAFTQNKSNLRLTAKDISQSLYNARNMAINWLDSNSWNVSVWVYFDNNDINKNKIALYSYPYDTDLSTSNLLNDDNKKLIKEIQFNKSIELNSVEGKDKFMFLFDAISWVWHYYYWDTWDIKKSFTWWEIGINISFKWTDSPNLTKNIKYIIWTNIIDY